MTHAPNNGIEDLYRSVIQDVIEQSKEAFLDENIDTDILFQIQKAWEDKINASGAADLNPKAATAPTSRPPQVKQQPSSRPSSSIPRGAPTMVVSESSIPSTSNNQAMPQFAAASDLPVFQNANGQAVQLQYLPNNMGQFVVAGGSGNLPSNLMMIPVQLGGNSTRPNIIQMTQEQLNQLPQNDGEGFIPDLKNAEISLDLNAGTLVIDTSKENSNETKIEEAVKNIKKLESDRLKPKKRLSKKKTRNLALIIPQVDGGPHMSDSSSEEEEEDEDPLSRIVKGIDDKGEEEGEDDAGDEEPLNSDDDQSDDEDLETLFESTNIIVCQFEKVNRARNKWKFTLKDGIMHLEGKDYCFQKCTGEAEW